jgi:hypothetical protein
VYIRESKRKAKEKVKNRIRKGGYWFKWRNEPIESIIEDLEEDGVIAQIASVHGKPCSCAMCGNPRRYFNEVTIQEKKFEDEMEIEMEEVLDEC